MPAKRASDSGSETEAKKPRLSPSPAPSPSASPKTKPKTKATKTKPKGDDKAEKVAWTQAENRRLFELLCPKPMGIKWQDVSAQFPGRGAIACQRKWQRMQVKLAEAAEKVG